MDHIPICPQTPTGSTLTSPTSPGFAPTSPGFAPTSPGLSGGSRNLASMPRGLGFITHYQRILIPAVLALFIATPNSQAAIKFLAISDIHYGVKNHSKMGEDIGNEFLTIMLKEFENKAQQVDFIINLGDLPTHRLLKSRRKEKEEAIVFHGLYQADTALKPMFYITGNNDSLAGNYQPFETAGKSPLTMAVDWQGACAYCEGLIIDNAFMYSKGYYSSYVLPHNKDIMLIALNSMQFLKPTWMYEYPNQEEDASAQLAWFEKQLAQHHAKQLLIALHIPPGKAYDGSFYWKDEYLQQVRTLLTKYLKNYGEITLLAGHTHMDGFRKLSLLNNKSLYVYSIPSISPIHYNNPAMKMLILNDEYQVKNFTTYFTRSLEAWSHQSYKASGEKGAILPQCQAQQLTACLDSLTNQALCDVLEKGSFIGVKNKDMPHQNCMETYVVSGEKHG